MPQVWHDGEGWHALCNICLAESSASTNEDTVRGWFIEHDLGRHPERT